MIVDKTLYTQVNNYGLLHEILLKIIQASLPSTYVMIFDSPADHDNILTENRTLDD